MQTVFIERAQGYILWSRSGNNIWNDWTEQRISQFCSFIFYLTAMLVVHMPGINTRNIYHLCRPTAESSGVQKVTLYAGTEIFKVCHGNSKLRRMIRLN